MEYCKPESFMMHIELNNYERQTRMSHHIYRYFYLYKLMMEILILLLFRIVVILSLIMHIFKGFAIRVN